MADNSRSFTNGTGYRFGFQGQESDDEVNGKGNSVYFKYRVHDPRIGRFASIDPLAPEYPYLSPYHFSHNSPIFTREIEGLEGKVIIVDDFGTKAHLRKIRDANILEQVYAANIIFVPVAAGGNLVRKATSITKGDETYNRVEFKTAIYDTDFGDQYMVVYSETVEGQTTGKPLETTLDILDLAPGSSQTGGLLAKIPKATGQLIDDAAMAVKSFKEKASYWKLSKSRPKYKKGLRDDVLVQAKADAKGRPLIDPYTNEPIVDDWQMGHRPGYEYKHLLKALKEGRIDKDTFLKHYNNAEYYEPRTPNSNQRHLGEMKDSLYEFDQ